VVEVTWEGVDQSVGVVWSGFLNENRVECDSLRLLFVGLRGCRVKWEPEHIATRTVCRDFGGRFKTLGSFSSGSVSELR
jgi:hypothetical protein